jgi:hypothetical protein
MPEEFDSTNAASLLVRLHGNRARDVARQRANARMFRGDADGTPAWALVIKQIEDNSRVVYVRSHLTRSTPAHPSHPLQPLLVTLPAPELRPEVLSQLSADLAEEIGHPQRLPQDRAANGAGHGHRHRMRRSDTAVIGERGTAASMAVEASRRFQVAPNSDQR